MNADFADESQRNGDRNDFDALPGASLRAPRCQSMPLPLSRHFKWLQALHESYYQGAGGRSIREIRVIRITCSSICCWRAMHRCRGGASARARWPERN